MQTGNGCCFSCKFGPCPAGDRDPVKHDTVGIYSRMLSRWLVKT